jgi:hypothetical protein
MTEPTEQNLYVMQNQFGCIKVGRSVDPWERRRNLCVTQHCKVELVAAFEGGGEDEEAIHIELEDFRLEGEWFEGTGEARAAVECIFHLEPAEWKFDHDAEGTAQWLDHLRVVRKADFTRRFIVATIRGLRRLPEPDWDHDAHIFWCGCLAAMGDRPFISMKRRKGKAILTWYNPETDTTETVPSYTASVEGALLAWPGDLRPAKCEGFPIECCIAALTAIRARLPKIPRP